MAPPRDTSTGRVLEQLVEPVLRSAGYTYDKQVVIGSKPDGKPYKADIFLPQGRIAISLKWQQVGGTAEQKIPFEVIALLHLCQERFCQKAYLILGGNGWTPALKTFYLAGGLSQFISYQPKVELLSLEEFIARVNRRSL